MRAHRWGADLEVKVAAAQLDYAGKESVHVHRVLPPCRIEFPFQGPRSSPPCPARRQKTASPNGGKLAPRAIREIDPHRGEEIVVEVVEEPAQPGRELETRGLHAAEGREEALLLLRFSSATSRHRVTL